MTATDPVVFLSYARTPMGSMQGSLSDASATDLGATAGDLAVVPGSPADKAGIVENDIILEVDGVKIDDKTDFASIIRGKSVGQTINLKILHKGAEKNISVTLEAAPDSK